MRVLSSLIVAALLSTTAATAALKKRAGYPSFWRHQASCIRYKESRGNLRVIASRAAPDGEHAEGLYQFLPSTWRAHVPPRAHFPSRPIRASFAQQTFVAWRTWVYDHRSWREWNYECG